MTAQKHTKNYLIIATLINLLPAFFFATYQLFLLERGMDLLQINLINVAYMAANFFLEIPTGAIADVWGRKRSTQTGIIFLGLSFLIYYLADSFWIYVLAEIIGAIGATSISGALEAWYIDGQKIYGEHESYDKTFAREQQWAQFGVVFGSVIGAQVGQINLAYPWLLGLGASIIVFLIVSLIMKNDQRHPEKKIKLSLAPILKTSKESINYGLKNQMIIRLIAIGFILSASLMAINMQWPPLFQSFGWEVKDLGWLFALIAIFNALGGRLAPHFKKRHSQEIHALIFSQAITVIGIIGAGLIFGPRATLVFFLLHQAGRGMFKPLHRDLLNQAIEHDNRATILSFSEMTGKLGGVIGLLISGLLAKYYGIGITWICSGIFLALGFAVILRQNKKKSP